MIVFHHACEHKVDDIDGPRLWWFKVSYFIIFKKNLFIEFDGNKNTYIKD
jgi:hypothetical protein